MKILLLYEFPHTSIDELYQKLTEKGIHVAAFNIVNWKFRSKFIRPDFLTEILRLLMEIPRLRGMLNKLLRKRVLLNIIRRYTTIDIHYFSPVYYDLIKKFKEKGKHIKITIWGSDFYRSSTEDSEIQRKLFGLVDIIQIETAQISADFLKKYPEYSDKIRHAHFGITQFEIIDELMQNGGRTGYRNEFGIPEDKIVLTCGANRSEGHQHLRIMESIDELPAAVKSRLFLIFPMTYGGNISYIETVRKKADSLGLPYRIIENFMSIKNLAKLRILNDIAITIQVTDALSSAIQEYLYTGGILIAGNWLPYGILREYGINYITTTTENLTATLEDAISHLDELKTGYRPNRERLYGLSSWDATIKEWLTIYNELEKPSIVQ